MQFERSVKMSTTKRKREDEAEQLPNKRIKRDIGPIFMMESLHQELWIQILSNITLKKIQPIRQVCSQWNKLTRTMDYAKQMCINKFGIDIAPLRVSNLSSLSEVPDSELVFIPTTQRGGALFVDWFKYYELRTILRSFLFELIGIMEETGEEVSEIFTSDSDVTCDVIKSILEVEYFDDFDAPSNLRSLLFKLVPLFVQYKRFELAEDAIVILTNHDGLNDNMDIEDVVDYLDLHSLSAVQFPELSKDIFDCVIVVFGKYSDFEVKKEKVNKELVEQTCRRLIRLVIQLGSEQDDHKETIKAMMDRVDDGYGIQVIIDTLLVPNNRTKLLLDVIVPTCQEEFDKTDDWRIKESALLALNIAANNTMVEYNLACLEFALHALESEKLHENVYLAAIITLCTYSKDEDVILSQKQFDGVLKHLTDALIKIEPLFVLELLETFVILFDMAHSARLEITDSDLDYFHNNFFKALLTAGVVRDSRVDVTLAFEAMLKCIKILGERVITYLPQYREALFKLASDEILRGTDVTPTKLVSVYFEIGAAVNPSGYLEEFIEVLKQAEAGTVGFPVNVTEFYSLTPLDVFNSLHVDVKKWIEPLLEVFPDEVKELLEHAQQGTYLSNNAEQLPAYFPQSKLQWSEALERLTSTDPNDLPSLFNFNTPPNAIRKRTVLNVGGSILDHLTGTLQTDNANNALNSLIRITLSLKDNNEHILLEQAKKILNIIIYYLRLDLLEEWIHGATVLLAEVANDLSQERLTDYIIAVIEVFHIIVVEQECQSRLEELLDWVFRRIMSFSDPHPKLLQLFLNAQFNHCMELRNDLSWIKSLGYLEAIISNWPRTAWTALHEVFIVRHCAQNSYTPTRMNQINIVLLWQVLIKYYGFKQLMPLLFQKPGLRHYYESTLACLKNLDHIECVELRDMAQAVLPKFVNYCHLYSIDKSTGDLCIYNQHIMDQSHIGELLKLTNPQVVLTDFAGNYFSVFF